MVACLSRIASSKNESAPQIDAFDPDISEAFLVLSAAAKVTTDRLLLLLIDRPSTAHDLAEISTLVTRPKRGRR